MIERVESDAAFAELALSAELSRARLEPRHRGLATELSYGTLRLRGRLDASIAQVCDRKLSALDPAVRNVLRLGAYQLLFLTRVHDAAAVDESVKLARWAGYSKATGFVNAVLRRLAKERERLSFPVLEQDPLAYLETLGSLPTWLAQRWLDELGPEQAAALAKALNRRPPRTVRVSPGADRPSLAKRLGGRLCRYAPDGITDLSRDPLADPAFRAGEITIQDEASQLVGLLLDLQEGESVLDCCAAPGTKTAQLAQAVGPRGEVVALDLHTHRLGLVRRTLERLNLKNTRVLERDATATLDLRGKTQFSKILVDAPCTGLGVLARNPDARWRLEPADVDRSAELQLKILESVLRYLSPGGVCVYSVCTMTPEETSGVTDGILANDAALKISSAADFLPQPAKELVDSRGALRTWPKKSNCDGFYAVRFERIG